MAKKIILEDSQGNVLHPKTLGECVTTETGETVDGLVSKSQMFSPIIETDSSMSKVGVGTDIDVSLNVKDGAYEECVFEGRSLINHVRLNNRITSKSAIEIEEQPIDHTKAYLLKVRINEVPVFTSESDSQLALKIQYFHTGSTKGFISIPNSSMVKGYELTKVVTPVSESDTNKKFVLWMPRYVSGTLDVDVMFIPYQEGMENWDIPYFEGMASCKMPILRNVGANLFDINQSYDHAYSLPEKYFVENNKLHFINAGIHRNLCWWVKVNKGERIYCSCLEENIKGTMDVRFFPKKRVDNDFTNRNTWRCDNTIKSTICSDEWMLFMLNTADDTGDFVFANIHVSYHDTGYEDYKSNILRTSEEIVLRSVGDIKDSYNALTGEYVQRIVEYVFNGSESEAWHFAEMKGDNYRFSINLPTFGNKSADKTALICDRLKVGDIAQEPKQEQIATYNHDSNFELRITLSPSTLASDNVGELRRYLQANPIAIQYAVAEPTTAIIKPSTIPFAYANGHVILENGSSEQSLFPHLKYSVVTGRTGQVTQNAKVLRKQEQQIIGLEELLLTQIVQMEYERTLLQFDYELQMMMLG